MAQSEKPPIPPLKLGAPITQTQSTQEQKQVYEFSLMMIPNPSEAKQKENFLYEKISIRPCIQLDKSYSSKLRDGYVTFSLNATHRIPEGFSLNEYGLKIHISFDDQIAGNIAKGWNAIVGIFMQYGIARAKVAGTDLQKDDPHDEKTRGKQVTIYASLHGAASNWQPVLRAITEALVRNEVVPGYKPGSAYSNSIQGNCYLSYRSDYNPNGIGSRRPDSTGAFPPGSLDPLQSIDAPTPNITSKQQQILTVSVSTSAPTNSSSTDTTDMHSARSNSDSSDNVDKEDVSESTNPPSPGS